MSADEETFRKFLEFRFDKIDQEIDVIKKTLDEEAVQRKVTLEREATKRRTSDTEQVKRISHLEKRALVLATLVSIIYHFAVNSGLPYMKRKMSNDSHSSGIKR